MNHVKKTILLALSICIPQLTYSFAPEGFGRRPEQQYERQAGILIENKSKYPLIVGMTFKNSKGTITSITPIKLAILAGETFLLTPQLIQEKINQFGISGTLDDIWFYAQSRFPGAKWHSITQKGLSQLRSNPPKPNQDIAKIQRVLAGQTQIHIPVLTGTLTHLDVPARSEKFLEKPAPSLERSVTIIQPITKFNLLNHRKSYWQNITQARQQQLATKGYNTEEQTRTFKQVRKYDKRGTQYSKDSSPADLVLFVVHGTWSRIASSFWLDPRQQKSPDYDQIENFAYYLLENAPGNNNSIEIVSFRWTGKNENIARSEGATRLAKIIDDYYSQQQKLYTIAHSHGCNVVNKTTQLLTEKNSNKMLEGVFNIFTPVREDFMPDDTKVKRYFQFYSTRDLVQFFGAFQMTPEQRKATMAQIIQDKSLSAFFKGGRKVKVNKVYNVRVQYNGNYGPAHTDKAPLLKFLPLLVTIIEENYIIFRDLDANIETNKSSLDENSVQVAIRNTNNNIRMIPNINPQQFEQEKKQELLYSQIQENNFKNIYKRPIQDKGSTLGIIEQIKKGVKETSVKEELEESWEEISSNGKNTQLIQALNNIIESEETLKNNNELNTALNALKNQYNLENLKKLQDILAPIILKSGRNIDKTNKVLNLLQQEIEQLQSTQQEAPLRNIAQ